MLLDPSNCDVTASTRDDQRLREEVERVKAVVVRNAVTAAREPLIYHEQPDMAAQFLEVLRSDEACDSYNRLSNKSLIIVND